MKVSLILFLFTFVAVQAASNWAVVAESELPLEEDYQWRVWNERGIVKGFRREKPAPPERPDFKVDFTFAAKPYLLEIMSPKYLKYEDGWFAYINCGEFGGGLAWYSSDGAQTQEIAKKININGIIQIDGHFFVYGGLAHLGPPFHGFIRKLELVAGQWTLTDGVDLPSPVLLLIKPSSHIEWYMYKSFWVVCGTLIGHYDPAKNKIKYAYGYVGYNDRTRCLWNHKNPNSIASDLNRRIFIGTDRGILRLPDEKWVVLPETQSNGDLDSKLPRSLR